MVRHRISTVEFVAYDLVAAPGANAIPLFVILNTTVSATRSSFDPTWKIILEYGALVFDTTVDDAGNKSPSCIVDDWTVVDLPVSKRHINCIFPCSGILTGSG